MKKYICTFCQEFGPCKLEVKTPVMPPTACPMYMDSSGSWAEVD